MSVGTGGDAGERAIIANQGVAGESATIRIGAKSLQTRVFVAGITNSAIYGLPVVVSPTGRLGIQASSARYKRDIHDIGNASGKLMKLRPVTFRYKEDSTGALQYGLIAEEVARVYPGLVIRGEDGTVMGVRYDMLSALLLNEMRKQTVRIAALQQKIAEQQKQINALLGGTTLSETLTDAAECSRRADPPSSAHARLGDFRAYGRCR